MERNLIYISKPIYRVNAIRHLIQTAKESIVLQMYLFAGNDELRTLQPIPYAFPWARTLSDWLIEKKIQNPLMPIIVLLDTQTIEDPSRTNKGIPPLTRHRMEMAGIIVLLASLAHTKFGKKLFFPKISRLNEKWEQPNQSKKYTKREWAKLQNQWQTLHNVEDHRKNLVIDGGRAGIVFSHNVIDQAYLWQENTFLIRKELAREVWCNALYSIQKAMELPIQFTSQEKQISPWLTRELESIQRKTSLPVPQDRCRVLKSGPEILEAILQEFRELSRNGVEEILISSAYFSDMLTLKELIRWSKTIRVRILVDSCEALSLKPVLKFILTHTVNLVCLHNCRKEDSIELRVFPSTEKEMMHCKSILFVGKNSTLIAGQANFTPNSFSGAWMETSIYTKEKRAIQKSFLHFQELWDRSESIEPYSKMKIIPKAILRTKTYLLLAVLKLIQILGFQY